MARREVDLWREERAARERGFRHIAGIDEAGRGALAGPVVAAAVVLPPECDLPGVRDSKTLTPGQRERALERIIEVGARVAVGMAEPTEIDARNILRATHEAMRRAVLGLPERPDVALIDGLRVNPFPVPQIALVGGDGRSVSIAAASIVAKVTRDRAMVELDVVLPGYGFAVHKGYGTADHLARLADLGPCPAHRASFAPVALAGGQPALPLDLQPGHVRGERGEALAASALRSRGWEVLCERYRCRGGEIDIVARDGGVLVFLEVKTRRKGGLSAIEAVDVRKQERLAAAADAYLQEHGLGEVACRFDVVEVYVGGGGARMNHVRGAFDRP